MQRLRRCLRELFRAKQNLRPRRCLEIPIVDDRQHKGPERPVAADDEGPVGVEDAAVFSWPEIDDLDVCGDA